MPESIADRLTRVRERIHNAAVRCGRNPNEIELLAVSKFHPPEAVLQAVEAGQRRFGENRFQGCPEKIQLVRDALGERASELTWEFIGGLQSNKVKPVLEWFDTIQSLDRIKLINRADRIAGELDRTVHALVQVNISGADTQGGVEPDELNAVLDAAAGLEHLRIDGLMAIGPNTDDDTAIHRAFAQLRSMAEQARERDLPGVSPDTLSMGMTGDLEIAIEEGSTIVRVGTAIFGPRPT